MSDASATLVLNADANPVTVIPLSTTHWREAVRLIYLDRASVVESYDTWVIRSPSVQLKMPSIIMLKQYQQHNGKIEFSKKNLFLRDNYHCQYCGGKFHHDHLTFDHVVPRSIGGKTNWENIASACLPCNQSKCDNAKIKPLVPPRRPTYWELAGNAKKNPITVAHESWIPYLNWESDVTVSKDFKSNVIDGDLRKLLDRF